MVEIEIEVGCPRPDLLFPILSVSKYEVVINVAFSLFFSLLHIENCHSNMTEYLIIV